MTQQESVLMVRRIIKGGGRKEIAEAIRNHLKQFVVPVPSNAVEILNGAPIFKSYNL